jgi:hypothetical protein
VSASPTALTLRHLREQGWTAEVVERWVPGANVRKDLLGFVDVLAIRGGEVLAVQTTTASNVPARVRKIAEAEHVASVRACGWSIHVHGWAKRDGRWTLAREVDVS